MNRDDTSRQHLAVGIGAPLLAAEIPGYGEPLVLSTLIWVGIFLVLFWFILRPRIFPPGPNGV